MQSNGLFEASNYPYKAREGTCQYDKLYKSEYVQKPGKYIKFYKKGRPNCDKLK